MKLKTINIRGNSYVTVNERVKAFRQAHPSFSLITECISSSSEDCLFKASILDDTGRVIATGHAHEVRSSSNVNKTSYIENCETSAIGRALGAFGIGIDESYASADEVSRAIQQQQQQQQPVVKKPSPIDKKILEGYTEEIKLINDLGELKEYYKLLPEQFKNHVQIRSIFSHQKNRINAGG